MDIKGWSEIENKDNITEEDIRKYLDDIFKQKESTARKMILFRYCKTYGTVKDDTSSLDLTICNDPECATCQIYHKTFGEVSNWLHGEE